MFVGCLSLSLSLGLASERSFVEIPELRDLNQRVWELRELIPLSDPASAESSEEERVSRVIEVGDFLCYPDGGGGWVPSEPRWVPAGGSFASSGVGYRVLAPGETGAPIYYYPAFDDAEVVLSPAGLYVAQGDSEALLRPVVTGIAGDVSAADPAVLLYPGAFGDGVDLELVLTPSGIHQNLVFRKKLELPPGFSAQRPSASEDPVDRSARYVLRTEINLDAIGGGPERGVVVRGEPVLLDAFGRLCEDVEDEIFFTRKEAEADEAIWSFGPSWISSGSPAARQVGVATKSFERSGDSGKTYLCEALPAWVVEEFSESEYPWIWDYQTKQGTISQNTLWRGGETYWVKNLTVTNATLTIEPGATVKREPGTSFLISTGGKIIAVGEPCAMIAWCAAEDTMCGESVPAASGRPSSLLVFYSGASSQNEIRYCKFRGAQSYLMDFGALQTTAIRDNVFVVDGGVGAVRMQYSSSYVAATFVNNLFVSSGGSVGVAVSNSYGASSGEVQFSNNTFVGFSIGISGTNLYVLRGRENIFYDVRTPILSTSVNQVQVLRNAYYPYVDGRDSSPVLLTGSPFASCGLGDYFLNTGSEGQKCRFSGARSASAAGLADAQYTVNLPVVFASSQTVSEHTVTRSPLYPNPDTAVCLGYHCPRVDTLIGAPDADVTLTVTGALTLQEGSALAFRGSSSAKLSGASPSLSSVGDPFGDGWNTVLDKRAGSTVVGLRIESPARRQAAGGWIYFQSCQSPSAEVRYTRFWFGYISLANYSLAQFTLSAQDCRFEHGYFGLYANWGGKVAAENSLFRDSLYGLRAYGSTSQCAASLCTFDRNYCGIIGTDQSSLKAEDSLFTGDPLGSSYGIEGSSGGTLDEAYCAFWGLTAAKRVGGVSVPLHERSFVLSASPYDRGYPDESRWTIGSREFNDPEGSEILLEDAGSGLAQGGGTGNYDLGMRSATLKPGVRVLRDVGQVDIGYHEPVADSNADGMADLWVAYYGVTGGPGDDDDGDGASNRAEYEQGSRPKGPDAKHPLDTDGDAWYKAGNWYGQDYKEEGGLVDPRGDGNQTYGFVAGPVGYDPRRPPYLQNMEVSGTPATCAVTIYWGHDLRQAQEGEKTWLDGTSSDFLWVRKSTDTTFTGYAGQNAPDPQPGNLDPAEKLKLRRYRLTGLACDTLYFYKIEFRPEGGAGPGTFTPVYTFRTWPAEAGDYKFAVYGDTRYRDGTDTYCRDHQTVCDAILGLKRPDGTEVFWDLKLIVHVGDFVYQGGDVTDWNPHFFWPAAKVLRHLPFVTVAGNHEYSGDNQLVKFRAFFDRPGEPAGYDEWDYNFKLGDVHFFIADTKWGTPEPSTASALFSGLASSDRLWEIVFFHYPGYGHASGHSFDSLRPIRDAFFDRREANYLDKPSLGVTAVFCGHLHLYERALVGTDLSPPLEQLILGGGGAELHDEAPLTDPPHYPSGFWSPADRAYQKSTLNYCIVTIGSDKVRMEVFKPESQDPIETVDSARTEP